MRRALLGSLVVAAIAGTAGSMTFAAFSSEARNPENVVSAASDFRAPTVSALAISKSSGGRSGFVKQAGSYYVYAQVVDTGNPASGVLSVSADVSSLTAGGASVPLVAGSYTADGVSYNYRSLALAADGTSSEGARSFSVTATDNAANGGSTNGSVTVDNTPPSATDVQTANGSTTVGRAQAGDSVTFSFSEPVEPSTILSGWEGSATDVVVRLRNGGLLGLLGDPDDLQVFNAADSSAAALGAISLGRQDYVGGLLGGEIVRFGATGTPSTMTMSGNTVTVTLGTAGGGTITTAGGNGTAVWTPSAAATDRAANAASTATANESGAADPEF